MATNSKSTARTTTATRRPKAAAKVAVTSPVQVRTKVEARGYSPQRAVYAYVGAGQLAIEKSRELSERAIEKSREVSELALGKGVELSSKLVSTIRQPQDLSAKLTGDLGMSTRTSPPAARRSCGRSATRRTRAGPCTRRRSPGRR